MENVSSRQLELASKISEDAAARQWRDWKWQMRHCIRDIKTFEDLLGVEFGGKERRDLELTLAKFPLAVTPYYLSLIDPQNWRNDPVFLQSFPQSAELVIENNDMIDPLAEDADSPAPCITHRYPDRVLFYVSGACAMYCRHCTRKRKVGDRDAVPDKKTMLEGIEYIRRTPQVRDVLVSGGDPFLLGDERLDWLLGELGTIDHVEIVRIGTRTPVVLPYRITDDLCRVLRSHHPIWLNTHFNHPREITGSSREALTKLADAGIPLGNQSVLLAGVNDCVRIMKALVHKLVINRVRPYYLYQCDLSEGLSHFRTPIGKGIEIMEGLVGHTSGFAVPQYVIDAPGGGGKIRVAPNYILSWSTNKVVLRNYEGVITTYQEPDSYEASFCDRKCERCELHLNLDDAPEDKAIGIAQLLHDDEDAIALTPMGNDRTGRRDEE
ncbi:lysine 2,3-aminomutase [bacterium]|nr:lysine 2,3-aminomutase [bacterium]